MSWTRTKWCGACRVAGPAAAANGCGTSCTTRPPARTCDDCGGELFQRDDDSEETIRHRLEVYAEQTSPLIAFYADENILIGIDATGPVEEITSRAMAALRPFVR